MYTSATRFRISQTTGKSGKQQTLECVNLRPCAVLTTTTRSSLPMTCRSRSLVSAASATPAEPPMRRSSRCQDASRLQDPLWHLARHAICHALLARW